MNALKPSLNILAARIKGLSGTVIRIFVSDFSPISTEASAVPPLHAPTTLSTRALIAMGRGLGGGVSREHSSICPSPRSFPVPDNAIKPLSMPHKFKHFCVAAMDKRSGGVWGEAKRERGIQGVRSTLTLMTLVICFATLISATPAHAQPETTVPRFESTTCWFSNITRFTIDCGWLYVPEDHAQPEGATIRLAVAIIRSESADKQPDPIVFLAGGPGGGVVGRAPLTAVGLGIGTMNRDTILVDQRGMGLSEPYLGCPEVTPAYTLQLMSRTVESFQPFIDCRARLEAEGVNLEFYNTVQSAADFAALRTALGYEQINLNGVSYGTRLALTIVRDHPEGIRSVVLDSTLPLEINTNEFAGDNSFMDTFDLIAATCAADFVCNTSYPNLRQVYEDLYARFEANPVQLEVEGLPVTLNGALLRMNVFMMMYAQEAIVSVPAYLYSVAAGDYRAVEDAMRNFAEEGMDTTSIGSQMTITCAENAANTTYEQALAADEAQPAAFRGAVPITGAYGYQACEAWGMPEPVVNNLTVQSDIPTLVLAGQFDHITPPSFGQQVAREFPNSFYVEFPNISHAVTFTTCPARVMSRFLDDPTTAPTVDCTITLPNFVMDATATRPLARIGAGMAAVTSIWAVASLIMALRGAQGARFGMAWRASFRTVGWIALAASGLLIALMTFTDARQAFNATHVTMVQLIIPLIVGIQAALLFSPDDEPGLEVTLACPRPIGWTVIERLAVVLLTQSAVALIGTLLSLAYAPEQNALEAFARWLPPMLFFSGLGMFVTIRTRNSTFGAVIVGLGWFAFNIAGDMFLPGQPFMFPLNYVQPFLWMTHPFLAPDALMSADFWLNRVIVMGVGVMFILLTLWNLRDEETVLLNAARKATRKQEKQAKSGW
jgi:pimeloyl-ACP methyl ester carboxylesterase